MTIPQEAIEAANEVLASYGPVCNFPDSPTYLESVDKLDEGDAAETALAAAEPHLRKKWAEEEAAKLAKTTVGLAAIRDDDKAETQIAEPRPIFGFQPSDVDA